ncbi:MAG TPA: hypothetical protein VJH03_03960 [Blastocatellia bacterium]|nr:hypothetical protein [Blastocatellia bacterium]
MRRFAVGRYRELVITRRPKRRVTPASGADANGANEDPIARIVEWEEHRYDPGHYLGGNIHPLLTSRRPNKYGWVLIVIGAIVILLLGTAMRAEAMGWYEAILPVAMAALLIIAGVKLVKKPGNGNSRANPRK